MWSGRASGDGIFAVPALGGGNPGISAARPLDLALLDAVARALGSHSHDRVMTMLQPAPSTGADRGRVGLALFSQLLGWGQERGRGAHPGAQGRRSDFPFARNA